MATQQSCVMGRHFTAVLAVRMGFGCLCHGVKIHLFEAGILSSFRFKRLRLACLNLQSGLCEQEIGSQTFVGLNDFRFYVALLISSVVLTVVGTFHPSLLQAGGRGRLATLGNHLCEQYHFC